MTKEAEIDKNQVILAPAKVCFISNMDPDFFHGEIQLSDFLLLRNRV